MADSRKLQMSIHFQLEEISHDVDEFLWHFDQQVKKMKQSGVSEAELLTWLANSEVAESFKSKLLNAVKRDLSVAMNELTTNIYLDEAKGLSDFWQWQNEPTAKHCNTCKDSAAGGRSGLVKTLRQWQALGVPGAGTTNCDGGCRCSLLPVPGKKAA